MDEYDIYKSSNTSNENSSPNGEHIAILRSLVSVYERRLKRFQEEQKLLSDLTEFQYSLINKLGITPNNMILSPNENQQTNSDALKNSTESLSNENNAPKNESEEIENNQKETNSPKDFNNLPLDTQSFLSFLQTEINQKSKKQSLNEMFHKFPIFESAFFSKNFSFDIQPICEYLQTLNQEKRKKFYSEIWSSLNNLPYFFNSLFSLIEANSFHFLCELVESTLPHALNYSHAILYLYDLEKSILSIEKQKVKIDHILKDGLISNAIKRNQPILVDRNDPNIKFDDLEILVKHEKALFIPIADTSIVLAFFDKIGEFTTLDNLIAFSSASIVNEISHGLKLQAEIKERVLSYQRMGEIFIELSSICNIKDFLSKMEESLTKVFKCSKMCIFEASQSSQTFWKFEKTNNIFMKPIEFQIGHGIIGYSIAKRSIISLSLPEFSILFDKESDRPEKGYKIDSILTCPVFDENGEVRWSIVLYNKFNLENFTQDDISCIEIFSKNLHPVIESTLKMSKNSNETKNMSKSIEEADQMSDFLLNLANFEITCISQQIAEQIKELCPNSHVEIYSIDRDLNIIYLMSNDEIIIKKIDQDLNDPIVKHFQDTNISETLSDQAKRIFCPLINPSEKVIGLMVLNFSPDKNQNQSKITFSKLQKKLSFFNKNKNEISVSIQNSELRDKLTLLSPVVGQTVEFCNYNKKVNQLIQIRERIVDSLLTLDQRTIARLYPQIELNFIVHLKKQEKTEPFVCMTNDSDILKNYVSLISQLNQFQLNRHYLTFKEKLATKTETPPDEPLGNPFSVSNSFDVFRLSEKQISESLIILMQEIGIVSCFKFTTNQIRSCVNFIRNIHSNQVFENWQLSIDRIQFLNYFLKHTNLHKKFDEGQKLALFFYLILMNCDPIINVDDASIAKSRYFLEIASSFGVETSIFVVLSSIPDCSFFSHPKEEQNQFFKNIEILHQINNIDSVLSGDVFVLTALICSFSYLARDFDVSKKFVNLRFKDEENEFAEELIRYQLEFEMNMIILPAFDEFDRNNCDVDEIRKIFTDNLNKLTSLDV